MMVEQEGDHSALTGTATVYLSDDVFVRRS
jgi:hypothetical protein